jgi:hypothetical protein
MEETRACSSILMCVRASNTVFTVDPFGFRACIRELAENPRHRIALPEDPEELGIANQ